MNFINYLKKDIIINIVNLQNNPESRKLFKKIMKEFKPDEVERSGIKFEKGKYPKKYNAIIQYDDGNIKKIPFGDQRYGHYKDKTPLKLYSHLDHNDFMRRKLYYKRHNINYPKFSADWLAKRFLW